MTRPLRVQHPGSWTHVMSRGINREPIFLEDRDREHFIEVLEKAVERFRIRLHAYVLMGNHFHLLVETPEGNLSACLQWIKQAYSMWHNLKHDRVGPLFQGRFKSVPLEDAGWAYELSLYIHLNPLRLARFKLSRVERQGGAIVPDKQLSVKEATPLLRALRLYPWGSYRAYAGYARIPEWLTTETIFERAGGRDPKKAYRKTVQERLTGGVESELMEQLRDATAVGSAEFSAKVRKALRQSGREIAGRYRARGAVAFPLVIKAVERHIGESVVPGKRGGLGRDMVFKLARDLCGLTLRELGEQMGGVDYASVHMAIRRIEQKMANHSDFNKTINQIKERLLIV